MNSPWIVETTAETFEEDVFDRSNTTSIVVDFWAPWCAPCRMLGPVLEKLAAEYDGQFVLVKANTDQMPEAAGRFQVQGIPAVFGLVGGEVVDSFQGVLPEDQLRMWLDQLLQTGELAAAARLEEIDLDKAEARYQSIIDQSPRQTTAKVGLARVLLAQEKVDECRQIIDELQQRGFLEPEAEKIRATLDLSSQQHGDLSALRSQVEAQPDNFALQLELARSLAAGQVYEEALQICLGLVGRDRQGSGEEARKLMIEVFRVLPDDSVLTTDYRRKLSLLLY